MISPSHDNKAGCEAQALHFSKPEAASATPKHPRGGNKNSRFAGFTSSFDQNQLDAAIQTKGSLSDLSGSEQPNRSADVLTDYHQLFQADTLPTTMPVTTCWIAKCGVLHGLLCNLIPGPLVQVT